MSPELQFQIVNFAALPFWLLMIAVPSWWGTRRLMESFVAPGLFAALYVVLVVPGLVAIFPALLRPDLNVIIGLMTEKQTFVIAWIHYLAFDLFVGRWEYLDAQERGVRHWLLAPCLFLTLMFGPLGFIAYLAARLTGRSVAKP